MFPVGFYLGIFLFRFCRTPGPLSTMEYTIMPLGVKKFCQNLNSECSCSFKGMFPGRVLFRGSLWNATLECHFGDRGFSWTILGGRTLATPGVLMNHTEWVNLGHPGGSHEPYWVGEPEHSHSRPRGWTRMFPGPTTRRSVWNVFRTPIWLDPRVYFNPPILPPGSLRIIVPVVLSRT